MKIIIVGVGALGSHVVQFLRNIDADLQVIDFDKIDAKNVMSQFHGKPNLGKNKTMGLQSIMTFLFGKKIGATPHKLTTLNDDALLSGADLIVDCLDNAAARIIVQNFARRSHTPCVHGALTNDGTFGRVVWDEFFTADAEGAAGTPTCENGEHLPFIGLVASQLALTIQLFLQDGKKSNWNVYRGGGVRSF